LSLESGISVLCKEHAVKERRFIGSYEVGLKKQGIERDSISPLAPPPNSREVSQKPHPSASSSIE
jgi:hypothetical protein